MRTSTAVLIALFAILAVASATQIWNDFAHSFYDDFSSYK